MHPKKVLILAYDFPPYVSVGGLRPYAWYKYFSEFGIFPIVVTRQWQNKYGNELDYAAASEYENDIIEQTASGIIIKTAYKPNLSNKLILKYGLSRFSLLRKLITLFYELFQFVFNIGPKSPLYFAAKSYLKKNKVDCIIATGEPFVLFKYASVLSKLYKIPWCADYRDPWSKKLLDTNNLLINSFHSYFEKKIVNTAQNIFTVNEYFKHLISNRFQDIPIYNIANGFDPDSIMSVKNIQQNNSEFSIAYIGYIYPWHPVNSFLDVFRSFVISNPSFKLKLNFYGINNASEFNKMIEEKFNDIQQYILIHNKIPNYQLLPILAQQNVLLLFNYYSFPGTKIYDYIALNRKILFCYSNDEQALFLKSHTFPYDNSHESSDKFQEDLIKETNSGVIIENEEHLKNVLLELYNEFNTYGFIHCNTVNADKYSRKHQVKKLAEIIQNTI